MGGLEKRLVVGLSAWLVSATVVWSQAPVTTRTAVGGGPGAK